MCETCGCSDDAGAKVTDLQSGKTVAVADAPESGHVHTGHNPHHGHEHDHGHDPHGHSHGPGEAHSHSHGDGHAHTHAHPHGTTVELEREILAKNNRLAERNRGWFAGRNVLALNLVSSPGSGKTTLLERTIRDLGQELSLYVIEGDQQTLNDARR